MKKLIAIALLALAMKASAQIQLIATYGETTNTVTSSAVITLAGLCTIPGVCTNVSFTITNAPYTAVNSNYIIIGDPMPTAWAKANENFTYLDTNKPGNIIFTNTTTLAAGASATATNVGVVGGVAFFQLGIPQGNPGTNTITVTNYVFTNQVFQSKTLVTYTTNNAMWAVSNYLGRVHGLVDWSFSTGTDGGNPPMNIPVEMRGSYNGTNGWFVITNNFAAGQQFTTSNDITIVAITTGTSGRGGTIATPGGCTLFTLDDWRFFRRTNWMDYQMIGSLVAPSYNWQFANKFYCDTLFANAFNGNFARTTDTNGGVHVSYSYENLTVMDLIGSLDWVKIESCVASGWTPYDLGWTITYVPTNIVIAVAQTNLISGWTLQSSTNLALIAGFTGYTNYTTATNGGNLELTIPMTPQVSANRFFRVVANTSTAAKITPALQLPNGLVLTTPTTISTATNSTFGFGAGLMLCDTNYVYVSVGTNRWKRAALSSW